MDFDLIDTIEGTLDLLAESAGAKGIELASAMAPDLPRHLRGDPGRVRQILINLIGNAVKFTEKGEVIVRVSKENETKTNALVLFRVEDTGVGISGEAQGKLFQAFSQADGSTTRKYGGTGLGLAISKRLAELMQGAIGVRSQLGKGSTFWFTAELEKQASNDRVPDAARRDLVGVRVLVVDDNVVNRGILLHQLRAWEMEAATAIDGQEALSMLKAAVQAGRPYRVALLDVQMPVMDGWMLARSIKTDQVISATKLIILTSVGQVVGPSELQAEGIESYLVKPVKQSRLFDSLGSAVAGACLENATFKLGAPIPAVTFPEPGAFTERPRILVAEDNGASQKVALAQLQRLGYRGDPVANGLEVLSALKSIPYDIVLMDCQMPEMDGYEVTRAIREIEQSSGRTCPWKVPIYVIAITAHAMPGEREKCLAAGMNDYLSKPVRVPDLKAALERGQGSVQHH